ncbi:MAG: hypothetical protein H7A42_07900 [Chlamydiales bacterium]|nr:hypothetical protein [Chlamydiales bacterium]
MWEKRASGSGSENSTPKISTLLKKISPEVRRQKSIQIIQEKLGSLDLQSQFLSENISDIKRQIRTLRSISGDQAEFKHLEKSTTHSKTPLHWPSLMKTRFHEVSGKNTTSQKSNYVNTKLKKNQQSLMPNRNF